MSQTTSPTENDLTRAVTVAGPTTGPRRLLRRATVGLAVLVVFVVGANLSILGATLVARAVAGPAPVLAGVGQLRVVDAKVWRGAAPTAEGYEQLASRGVTTVVDLRAEDGIADDARRVSDLGMRYVGMPVRDGQIPSAQQISAFMELVEDSVGTVYVHCGAGVGRTGAMVGAYRVLTGQASGWQALVDNLAVGPPSLEQISFVAGAERGRFERPNPVATALSRLLDAPRRTWHVLGF